MSDRSPVLAPAYIQDPVNVLQARLLPLTLTPGEKTLDTAQDIDPYQDARSFFYTVLQTPYRQNSPVSPFSPGLRLIHAPVQP